jgi:hypothetical protein
MKKGCFLQLIIILTIITAAVVYIIQNHLDDLVIKPGKKMISGFILNEFDDKFEFVKPSPEKDSLKVMMNNIILSKIDRDKEISSDDFREFFNSINHVFADSVIDQAELNEIKQKVYLIK